MRILHILDHSLPLHSGYVFRSLAILREQRALGWQTLQLTTPRHGKAASEIEEVDGWRFHRTPLEKSSVSQAPGVGYVMEMRATARRIEELAKGFNADILHAHSPVLNALPALRAGREGRHPLVYGCAPSGRMPRSTTARRPRAAFGIARRARARRVFRRAGHITTICEGLRREITGRGIPPERVTVIPNAVDAREFNYGGAPDPALSAALGLDGATVLGFAGSFYAYEGLDLLLEAAALLAPHQPNLRVLLVGGGPQEAALKAQAARLSLTDRVVFTGRVPHADVQRYYDLIDVLAYPRHRMRLTDLVTPLKPLEAMAQGRMFVARMSAGIASSCATAKRAFLRGR
jgi:PEP-CTERM/exosortase A-associated glycosyltransferase